MSVTLDQEEQRAEQELTLGLVLPLLQMVCRKQCRSISKPIGCIQLCQLTDIINVTRLKEVREGDKLSFSQGGLLKQNDAKTNKQITAPPKHSKDGQLHANHNSQMQKTSPDCKKVFPENNQVYHYKNQILGTHRLAEDKSAFVQTMAHHTVKSVLCTSEPK